MKWIYLTVIEIYKCFLCLLFFFFCLRNAWRNTMLYQCVHRCIYHLLFYKLYINLCWKAIIRRINTMICIVIARSYCKLCVQPFSLLFIATIVMLANRIILSFYLPEVPRIQKNASHQQLLRKKRWTREAEASSSDCLINTSGNCQQKRSKSLRDARWWQDSGVLLPEYLG